MDDELTFLEAAIEDGNYLAVEQALFLNARLHRPNKRKNGITPFCRAISLGETARFLMQEHGAMSIDADLPRLMSRIQVLEIVMKFSRCHAHCRNACVALYVSLRQYMCKDTATHACQLLWTTRRNTLKWDLKNSIK